MSRRLSPSAWAALAGAAVLLLLPLVVRSKFALHNLILVFLYASLAASWNILGGLAGQHSMGHAAYFGIGAYTSTLLFIRLGISPWIGFLAGVALVAVFALAVSYPAIRLRGPFFTLASIAIVEVLRRVAIHWRSLTEGSVGLTVPFKPGWQWMIWRGKEPYYYLTLLILIGVVALTYGIRRSRVGYYLRAMRADEDAAAVLGVSTTRYKLMALLISAVLTGMLGTIYAQYMYFIEPDSVFSLDLSIELVLLSVIGGLDSVMGPVLGAALVVPLNEFLRGVGSQQLQGLNFFIYGVVLIIVVILMPNGIIPTVRRWWERLNGSRLATAHTKGVAR